MASHDAVSAPRIEQAISLYAKSGIARTIARADNRFFYCLAAGVDVMNRLLSSPLRVIP